MTLHTVVLATIVAFHVLSALSAVAMVGRLRPIFTPGAAVFTLIVNAALIYGVLYIAGDAR